jgi:phage/plasmid-associated DNA primase
METKLKKINNDIQKGNIIIDKLKNVNFKESICKECLYLFYNPEFIFNLDKKENLVCFKNVVYDVKNNTVKVPEKDDMISIYIDVEYVEPTEKEDTDSLNELIEKFSSFRKNLLKKRHPKNVYNLATY